MFILIWATTVTVVKHIQTTIKIEDFKSKAILTEDEEFKDVANTRFYKVASNEERPTMFVKNKTLYPGLAGDIIVTLKSGFSDAFVDGFITFYAGGHAAMISDNFYDTTQKINLDNTKSIEATGLSTDGNNTCQIFDRSYWSRKSPYTEVICLRVNMTDIERREVISNINTFVGDDYNYSFLFNTINTSYCSDIMFKSFRKIGKNLNKDGFATTIYDLIVSGDCYISYYHYFDDAGIKHVYYLG